MAAWGAEFGAKVAEEIHEGRVPVLTWIGDYFDGRETVTERSGRFDRDEIEVECACEAGSFSLRGAEGDGYALTVRQRFGQADGPVIEADGGRLFVRGSGIVRGDLVLPRGKRCRLRLRSSAGRIELGDLTVSEATLTTEAGSIRLADLRGDSLTVNSSAGSIEGTGLAFRELGAETDCGRVHLALAPAGSGHCRLETDVGVVVVVLPIRPDLGYRLLAETSVGGISCPPSLVVRDESRLVVGHRRLAAESPQFSACRDQVEIEARTDCGSIRITTTDRA